MFTIIDRWTVLILAGVVLALLGGVAWLAIWLLSWLPSWLI